MTEDADINKIETAKQHKASRVIFTVFDEDKQPHIIFGDEFAEMALNDIIEKLNSYEVGEAVKQWNKLGNKKARYREEPSLIAYTCTDVLLV